MSKNSIILRQAPTEMSEWGSYLFRFITANIDVCQYPSFLTSLTSRVGIGFPKLLAGHGKSPPQVIRQLAAWQ